MDLAQFTSQHEITESVEFNAGIKRYKKAKQKRKDSWYIAFETFTGGKGCQTVVVGDHAKGDERHTWKSYSENEIDMKQINKEIKLAQKIEQENKLKLQAQAAEKIKKLLTSAQQGFEANPYFERKLITSDLGTYRYKGRTLVPMQNPEGLITSVQSIFDSGDKRFFKGGAIKGSYHLIGEKSDTLYICEGFATGASLHYATGKQVVVCFMASNLEPVALSFKDRKIIICADNDKYKDKNAGLDAATKVKARLGVEVVFPAFKDESSKPTDFNDLHVLEGLEAVKKRLISGSKKPCEFLGYSDAGYFFYSDRSKMIKCYSTNQIKQGHLIEMVSERYWADTYVPKNAKAIDECNWNKSCSIIIEQQQRVGHFDVEKVKGFGSWLDGKKHVVHVGNNLIVDNKPVEISEFKGRNFYYPAKQKELDWEKTKFDFKPLIDASRLIDFKTEADRIAFVGFIAQSAVFTTQRWRSNIWLNAPKGSGKSVLLEFLSELCINSLFVQDTTVAGIRQSAKYDSKTVLYDEAEGEQARVKSVLEMARTCSSSGGSKVIRGTALGKSMTHSNDFLFCFASIRQPALTTADQSRITTVRLKSNEENDRSTLKARELSIKTGLERTRAMDKAQGLGNDIFIYMNQNYRDYKETRTDLIEVCVNLGMTKRQADQAAGLLAGYAMLSKEPLSEAAFKFYEDAEEEIKGQETDSETLVNTIKDTMIRFENEDTPIGELMAMAKRYENRDISDYNNPNDTLSHAKKTLEFHGIYYLPKIKSFAFRKNTELNLIFSKKTNFKDIFQAIKGLDESRSGVFAKNKTTKRGVILSEKALID